MTFVFLKVLVLFSVAFTLSALPINKVASFCDIVNLYSNGNSTSDILKINHTESNRLDIAALESCFEIRNASKKIEAAKEQNLLCQEITLLGTRKCKDNPKLVVKDLNVSQSQDLCLFYQTALKAVSDVEFINLTSPLNKSKMIPGVVFNMIRNTFNPYSQQVECIVLCSKKVDPVCRLAVSLYTSSDGVEIHGDEGKENKQITKLQENKDPHAILLPYVSEPDKDQETVIGAAPNNSPEPENTPQSPPVSPPIKDDTSKPTAAEKSEAESGVASHTSLKETSLAPNVRIPEENRQLEVSTQKAVITGEKTKTVTKPNALEPSKSTEIQNNHNNLTNDKASSLAAATKEDLSDSLSKLSSDAPAESPLNKNPDKENKESDVVSKKKNSFQSEETGAKGAGNEFDQSKTNDPAAGDGGLPGTSDFLSDTAPPKSDGPVQQAEEDSKNKEKLDEEKDRKAAAMVENGDETKSPDSDDTIPQPDTNKDPLIPEDDENFDGSFPGDNARLEDEKNAPPDNMEKNMPLPERNNVLSGVPQQSVSPNISPDQEDHHFFPYFLTVIIIVILAYLIIHNKQKILGLIVEGRGSQRRRSHSYRKLDTEGSKGTQMIF